jgi:hypothetical protein
MKTLIYCLAGALVVYGAMVAGKKVWKVVGGA